MLDLRAGQPVPRERLGRAAETLDALNAADDAPPERRDRSR